MSNKSNWQRNRYKANEVLDLESIRRNRYRPAWAIPLTGDEIKELELYLRDKVLLVANPEVLLEKKES